MVKNIYYKIAILALTVVSGAACSTLEPAENPAVGSKVRVSVEALPDLQTKAVYDGTLGRAKWTVAESIGVTATCGNTFTDNILQPFVSSNTEEAANAAFAGELTERGAGDYTLYAVSPYHPASFVNGLSYTLPEIQYPLADGWDPTTDYMVGSSALQPGLTGVGDASGAISFSHILGWLKLSFKGFDDAADETVTYVRISSGSALAGTFSIPSIDTPAISKAAAAEKFIIADFSEKNITLADLEAYLTVLPGSYESIDIAVRTSGHYIECTRMGLTIEPGKIVNAVVNKGTVISDSVATSMASICGAMPQMASKTDGTLNVLLLGHSFGEDATYYLPQLFAAAGITNSHIYRFYEPDCSLQTFWNFIKTNTTPARYALWNGTQWAANVVTINEKFRDTKWDVIVFQQATATSGTWREHYIGAADYSTYQPYLSLLMEYAHCAQQSAQGNTPLLAWNMIRSYNMNKKMDADYDATTMYNAIASATDQMATESGIRVVIKPGEAIQQARQFYTDPYYHLLLRDGWHASNGIGRYLEACTWFEQLYAPIYNAGAQAVAGEGQGSASAALTVVGNTFLPTEHTSWTNSNDAYANSTYDVVDADKAYVLQRIAHNVACPDDQLPLTPQTPPDPSGE